MFTNLRNARDVTKYNLFRGTTDWSALYQFDYFEQGYPYLVMINYPEYLKKIADPNIRHLIDNYNHIIEYEFVGLDSGIDDITSDEQEINNGMQTMTVLTKTVSPSATKFSMTYKERAGSILSRMHEFYLRNTRDPGSGFKTYGGLIGRAKDAYGMELNSDDKSAQALYTPDEISFDKETWSFLYMHTDPTGLALEQAIYYVGCYPTSANLTQYQAKRGEIAFSDVTVEFSGFPIRGSIVNYRAKQILDHINDSSNEMMARRNSWDFRYKSIGRGDGNLVNTDDRSFDASQFYLGTVGSNGYANSDMPYINNSDYTNGTDTSSESRNNSNYGGGTNTDRI